MAIDYPAQGSIFPPEITPPTFLWRDSGNGATAWQIEISFTDGSPTLRAISSGPHLRTGPIDPLCVAPTNEPPSLTSQQAAERTWAPGTGLWEKIKQHSVAAPATVTITGFRTADPHRAVSRGEVTIHTSKDPVGAPIFYRDVPLMPAMTQTGVIRPIPSEAVRLIAWRLRDVSQPKSRVVMDRVLVCANCHSFSADGKTLGMDLDGLEHNKGLYMMLSVRQQTEVRDENVMQWRTAAGKLNSELRVGFMSQVSPAGRYVVTTLDPAGGRGSGSNYFVANFTNYRFLQVFYPTRGILAWYSRETGILQPLPGADDPHFVQTNAVWSPDGSYLVFARAEAEEPNPPGRPLAKFANDPNERQIHYDLYRIPFNDGRGGTPEPIAGASQNGMSNTFPKVSPDGRWIVFVKCRNGLLMRPDSELYIVPAAGGAARRMTANQAPMNSWHSFSPNGRWLVFSSKRRSPYTQMYLTHIDENGNDSPAIYVENTTAANRAVNIPEFVNVPPGGLESIDGPVLEYYRRYDRAMYLQKQNRLDEAIEAWGRVLETRPNDAPAQENLGAALLLKGEAAEAVPHFNSAHETRLRQALAADPTHAATHNDLGLLLLQAGRPAEAALSFRKAVELQPSSAEVHCNLGSALFASGDSDGAIAELHRAITLDPQYAPAYCDLGTVLATRGDSDGAIAQWRKALAIRPEYTEAHGALGDALYARGEVAEAVDQWREAIRLQPGDEVRLRQTAWVLATNPQAQVRNGTEAVTLAVRAVNLSAGKDPAALDTLAAAYAETGQFESAIATERRALAVAAERRLETIDATEAMTARSHLYESGKPFRTAAALAW
jgi:tetratricopeptide (TPR) repeat protein